MPSKANKERRAEEARLDNYGIRAVEILQGGVGYFRIDYFDGHIMESMPALAAAMNLMENSEAIILDLRYNGGGNSRILPVFLGYFLGPDPVHLGTLIERWKDSHQQVYTYNKVGGARHHNKPIYILTSGTTFSLAEALVYNLKAFDRATIIGERTYGGGNAWDPVVLNDDFYLRIPRMAFVNSKTGTYFVEGEGISPDIAVDASKAKDRAYLEALKALHTKTVDTEKREKIDWAQKVVMARLNPHSDQSDAIQYVGQYDHFIFENRADGLWLSYRELPFVKLEKLASGLYLDDRAIQRQFHFTVPAQGKQLTSVTVTRYGEKPQEIIRSN